MAEEYESISRSYVGFERTAKGVVTPKVKIVNGDHDEAELDKILVRAIAVFRRALEFAEEVGEKP